MSDLPFWSGGSSGGGGGGGTTDYNALANAPVKNLTGSPVVISTLSSGVYNIDGTWAITEDDTPRETGKDDLFYVWNEEEQVKVTWISAGNFYTYSVPSGGTADEIVEDSVATIEKVVSQLIGTF